MDSQMRTTVAEHADTTRNGEKQRIVKHLRTAGLALVTRYHTDGRTDPYDQLEWEQRTAVITGEAGQDIFRQEGVEVPVSWSQMATNVVASKYFRGILGTSERESSVKELLDRVVHTITNWGVEQGYFSTLDQGDIFRDELKHLLANQYAAFNSPVWFNCGVEQSPQVSACFINAVDDSLDSILNLAVTEGKLFKFGSGTGTNFSRLRGSNENLSGGGTASGPVSFMRGFDAFAGVIKSGGKTRRAAKMVILDVDHPDIENFVTCKAHEEKKAWALIESGYDGSFNGEAYQSVAFQNANHSVRVTEDFMKAVEADEQWALTNVSNQGIARLVSARELLHSMAKAAHLCGDPGIQFDTTINNWHTCKSSGRINASNPCSEFMFLDDSACNLASLNLMKFVDPAGQLDTRALRHAVQVLFIAQEIVVDKASYPTKAIDINSRRYRPLGLGYANLGAYLMCRGLPYDSDEARAHAAVLTAMMTGEASLTSTKLAAIKGPFEAYDDNQESMLKVMEMHRQALKDIDEHQVPLSLKQEAMDIWNELIKAGERHGFRNAQATLLAPTGTIGFLMDCDTTGIEPDTALVKYKQLVGGGTMRLVNNTIPNALSQLGYDQAQRIKIMSFVEEHGTVEGAPYFKEEHLPVFDCALRPINGKRSIKPMGRVRMMAAVQPFLSGAISKTVNMSSDTTVDDIADVYRQAWKLGLKSIAIYRDGSKRVQPLSTGKAEEKDPRTKGVSYEQADGPKAARHRLPTERMAITHKFTIGGHEGYITVGMYKDGTPGEIFIVMAKEGSTVSGLMDAFATSVSMALQYGVPLRVLVDKFSHTRFEPAGFTGNPEVPIAKSVMDYIFRWLEVKFLKRKDDTEAEEEAGHILQVVAAHPEYITTSRVHLDQVDAPACATCGSIMVRSGSCYRCINCGATSGCS